LASEPPSRSFPDRGVVPYPSLPSSFPRKMTPMSASPIGRNVWTLSAANFLIAAFTKCYMLLPAYLAAAGVSDPGRVGWLMGSFYVSSFIRPFVGWLTDAAGFRRVLFFSGVLAAVSGLGILAANPRSLILLIAFRILTGIAYSLFAVALTAYQTLALAREGQGAGLSVITSTNNLPFLLVVPACEALLSAGFLKTYLLVPVLLAAGTCAVAARLPRVDLPPGVRRGKTGKTAFVLAKPQVRMLLVSITLFCAVDAGLLSISALGREKGLSVSGFFAASAVTSLLVRFFGRSLADRLPRIRTSWVCPAVSALLLAACALPFIRSPLAFGACGALYGLFIGLGYPVFLVLIADVAGPEERGRVTSLFWFFMGLAYLFMPVITGYLAALLRYKAAFFLLNLALVPLLAFAGLRWEKLQAHRLIPAEKSH
jgi:MFS family permease